MNSIIPNLWLAAEGNNILSHMSQITSLVFSLFTLYLLSIIYVVSVVKRSPNKMLELVSDSLS